MNIYAWLHLITALVSGTLGLLVWRRRTDIGGVFVVLLMLAVTVWALTYGFELASTTLAAMRFWVRLEYLGISTGPVFWLLFAIRYTGHDAWLSRRTIAALFIIPSLTILLNATNEWHRLYYRSVGVDRSGPIPLFAIEPGPWYWVQVVYSLLATVAGTWLIAWMWQQTPRVYRSQLSIIMAGACFPLGVNVLYLVGIRPLGHIDLTPLALALTGGLVYWGLFRYNLFDVSPLARNVLFEQLHDAVIVLDARRRIVDLNRTAEALLGQTLPEMIGRPVDAARGAWPELVAFAQRGDGAEEVQLARLPSTTFEARRAPLRDGRSQAVGAMLVLRDSTARTALEAERERLIARLEDLAHTDELTGVLNRRALMAAAEREALRAARTGEPLGIILIDIDYFKQINDTYGHAAGDQALRAVAQCCCAHVRTIDFVGRYGGEEFIILLPNTSEQAAYEVAERLRAQVAVLVVQSDTAPIQLTASMGVAAVLPPGAALGSAFQAADTALYAAKRAGRNHVVAAAEIKEP